VIAQQKIVRVRRKYNQWVANQTLEDYALRFTAKSARRWSSLRVANTAIGAISFLALEAIGGKKLGSDLLPESGNPSVLHPEQRIPVLQLFGKGH